MQNFNKHLIIVGSARSGTSWLSEVIARQFRYRMLFEPEHEFNTPKGKLIADQWRASKDDSPEAHQYLKKVFANRVDSDWIAQNSNRKYKMHLWPLIPKMFIIKFVRANLSAKYMNEAFNIPVIHIIRNPYDVLASQQRVRFPWLYNLDHFKGQSKLVRLVEREFGFNLKEDTQNISELEILTIRWCLENVLPLQVWKPSTNKYSVVKHEDLRNDIQVFIKLSKEFNFKPVSNIDEEYNRPSTKTHPKSTIINKNESIKGFNQKELLKINGILDVFKCNLYPRKQY